MYAYSITNLYTDDGVFGCNDSISEGHHRLVDPSTSIRHADTRVFDICAHLSSNVPDDSRKRMIFDLSMFVPRSKVSQLSLGETASSMSAQLAEYHSKRT